ncbi:uncharacterized protein UHOD_11873 [Ustilago sp. UG-2017b]|nr:uncharacterized protein UHOD_11873 [Ustilago sp. UG-2017b]
MASSSSSSCGVAKGSPSSTSSAAIRGQEPSVRGLAPETQRWLGTISIDMTVMMTPRSGVSVDGDEIDGVGDKVVNMDLLAGLLYTALPPSTGDGSFDSCLSSP